MKKLFLIGMSCGCFSFVSAEDASESWVLSDGCYFSGGVSFVDDGAKIESTAPDEYHNGTYMPLTNDPLILGKIFPHNENGTYESDKLDNTGQAIDQHGHVQYNATTIKGGNVLRPINHTAVRGGGTLLVGFRKIFEDIPTFVALEAGADFTNQFRTSTGDQKSSGVSTDYCNSTVTRSACNPFVAIRIGYIDYSCQLMPYFKFGISKTSIKEKYQAGITNDPEINFIEACAKKHASSFKFSSWQPTLAFGLEKFIDKDLTGRVEFEYRFSKTKNRNLPDINYNKTNPQQNAAQNDKCLFITQTGGHKKLTQTDSFTIRLLVTYNVRL